MKGTCFLISFLIFSLAQVSFAQVDKGTPREDKILMRSGEEYHGDIVEQIPDSVVVLEMVGGSRLVIRQRDIREILPVEHRYRKIKYFVNRNRSPLMVRTQGFSHQLSFSIYPRQSGWGGTALNSALTYTLNYRFSHLLAAGAGSGIEAYEGGAAVPFYLQLSGDLFPGRVTPSYSLRTGYALGVAPSWINIDFDGGFLLEAAVGIKHRTRSRLEGFTGIGYRRQPVREVPNTGFWNFPTNEPQPVVIERVYSGLFIHYTLFF